MKRITLALQWLKSCADAVGTWWGIMSGAFSIPFAFLALFDVPGRLLFASLAYVSLWALVVGQARRISELQKPMPRPNVIVRFGRDLIDIAHGSYWIRGEIENASECRAESCHVKFIRVAGENPQYPNEPLVENGPLQWQGGGCEPRSLDAHEKLIFDLAIRPLADYSPLVILIFFSGNEVRRELDSPGCYKVTLAVYGKNIATTQKIVSIKVGKTARENDFVS